ncbi:MAG: hypothetical protein H0V08_02095 [Thermoleophilaceae bacterium]|nr:hypothetical protein [Thermoleophilaceae bacterium]
MPTVSAGAAQAWFTAGTIPLILAGGAHALLALRDTVRPRSFAPIERSVKPAIEDTGIRLVGKAAPSMWRVWLGINITFGLGLFSFGLVCLLIATHDFKLVEEIDAIRPLTIAFSAALFAVSLRFFFYGPVIITGVATTCFTIATVLSL